MNKHGFQIGPGAASLLLIAVVLCMSVMGILNLVSAHNDALLSERSAAVTEAVYGLNALAEQHLAELDALLPADSELERRLPERYTLEDTTVSWAEDDGEGRRLLCAVRLKDNEERYEWIEHRLMISVGNEDEEAFFD